MRVDLFIERLFNITEQVNFSPPLVHLVKAFDMITSDLLMQDSLLSVS